MQTTTFRTLRCFGLIYAFSFVVASALAAGSAPKNLRVLRTTDWIVELKWDAPTGRAPSKYAVQSSTGAVQYVPGNRTTVGFNQGFSYLRNYTFRAFAIDSRGNWSGASNQVAATLQPDVTPPTTPVVGLTEVGPRRAMPNWSSFDAAPHMWFNVYRDDVLVFNQIRDLSRTNWFLQPNTTYSYTVRSRDAAGNWSAISAPFEVNTPSSNPADVTAPSAPPALYEQYLSDTELAFAWSDSTDDFTLSPHIEYLMVLNGQSEGGTSSEWKRGVVYLTSGAINTVEVFARDEAGNVSAASTLVYDLRNVFARLLQK